MVLAVAAAVLATLGAAAWLAFRLSPWPAVLLIRRAPGRSGREIEQTLAPLVPDGIEQILDERYDLDDPDGFLDVFTPLAAGSPLPTVVWLHGGGFIGGSRTGVRNYLRILAARGYTTVAVEYSHAPERRYPTPVLQVDAALAHLVRHADRLHIDPAQIVLAGDSAGAHIAAQAALALTDPTYADRAGLPTTVRGATVRATILACGPYDLDLPDYDGPHARLLHTVLWAYTGVKDFRTDPRIAYASLPRHVSATFPPTFLTVGNADPLRRHSAALAESLATRGVSVDTLFYPDDHEPPLGHEYQLDLTAEAGRQALNRMVLHLQAHTVRPADYGRVVSTRCQPDGAGPAPLP
ncbi:alpha/beta hydrolase [Micromonospora sp. NPDC047812]|uniref:alpha/beta hydrolase n=1 Tax=Micromonospora sp. NPDC047812 TaxID=3155742 RepID=UPI0034538263